MGVELGSCILWTKCTGRDGYGRVWFEGRMVKAHRLAFFLHHGYWPNICRHSCDVKACVNPDHLLDGTQADNVRDAIERGRFIYRDPTINPGMPSHAHDHAAYQREVRRRKKAMTWIYRA